ncbi:MAG TPA: helix-turn-helix transcriptional regulator [Stenomitos sp.]
MKARSLGDSLKRLRTQKGLSRAKAAKAAKISATRLYEFEVGISSSTGKPTAPSREQLKRLAAVYEVPAEELLERAGYVIRNHSEPPDVERLLELYRRLPLSARETLLTFLKSITS